jgi:hypothetical protein
MPQTRDLGGRHAEDFYVNKNPTASAGGGGGVEPAPLGARGARGQHANHQTTETA